MQNLIIKGYNSNLICSYGYGGSLQRVECYIFKVFIYREVKLKVVFSVKNKKRR